MKSVIPGRPEAEPPSPTGGEGRGRPRCRTRGVGPLPLWERERGRGGSVALLWVRGDCAVGEGLRCYPSSVSALCAETPSPTGGEGLVERGFAWASPLVGEGARARGGGGVAGGEGGLRGGGRAAPLPLRRLGALRRPTVRPGR